MQSYKFSFVSYSVTQKCYDETSYSMMNNVIISGWKRLHMVYFDYIRETYRNFFPADEHSSQI